MGKVKTKRRRKFSLPVALVGGTVAGAVMKPVGGNKTPLEIAMQGNYSWALHELVYNYTGYHGNSGKWMPQNARGLWAMVAGIAAHKAASLLGVNRELGRYKIPIIRI